MEARMGRDSHSEARSHTRERGQASPGDAHGGHGGHGGHDLHTESYNLSVTRYPYRQARFEPNNQ